MLVAFRCDPDLRAKIEEALGDFPMSQFLRDAVVAKLESMKIHVERELAKAPSRLGKGGRPKKAKR